MITVYSQPACPQCRLTERRLDAAGIPHVVVDVTEDHEAGVFVRSLGATTTPVVVLPDGEWWQGFRPDLLKNLSA